MKARIENYDFSGRRIIAISDIHGNLPYLKELLKLVSLRPDDVIIVVGDFMEKGDYSLDTLRYLMELQKSYELHALQGNCDSWTYEIDNPRPQSDKYLMYYMLSTAGEKGRSFLSQMAAELGLKLHEDMSFADVRPFIKKNFKPELDFIRACPHIIRTERADFVHGGLPAGPEEFWDSWDCMKNDFYLHQGHKFSKWLVVGHTPSMLYGTGSACANPLFDFESKIISIDGGCSLIPVGQLNALIINPDGSFDFESYDSFPVAEALDNCEGSENFCYVRWGRNKIHVLSDGGDFVEARLRENGELLKILKSFLYRDQNGSLRARDYGYCYLAINKGERLSVIENSRLGFYVKKDGVLGFYRGKLKYI